MEYGVPMCAITMLLRGEYEEAWSGLCTLHSMSIAALEMKGYLSASSIQKRRFFHEGG
jgi:hypothetical protein